MGNRVKLIEKAEVRGEVLPLYEQAEQSRGGTMPNMFKMLSYSNEMLESALGVANFCGLETKVPAKHKQLAYLTVSRVNDCEYCLERHSVAGLKQGLTVAQIEALHQPGELIDNPAFDNREKVIIRFAEELTKTGTLSSETFNLLHEFYGDEEIVELVYTASSANMFNRIAKALDVELEPAFKK